MQTKHLCVLIHIWTKGEVGAPLNRFKPSSKIFYWPFQGGTSFVDLLYVFFLSCVCLVRVFSDVLVAFLYFDICHYRQSNLAIENPEFSQPVVAGHFQWKIW